MRIFVPRDAAAKALGADAVAAVFFQEEGDACEQVHHRQATGLEAVSDF